MITKYKIFKENLLKPTVSKEDKAVKIHNSNKQLLMENEVLTFNDDETFEIDDSWDFDIDTNLIKTKKIKGMVKLDLNHIPSWLKDIQIDGYFDCDYRKLTSLVNCPKIINKSFWCNHNKLTSLKDGPKFVGGNYFCKNNAVKFTEEYVHSICLVDGKIFV